MSKPMAVASYEAGRQLLAQGRRAVGRRDLDKASASFSAAIQCFAGPTALLGGAHAWRGLAEVAIAHARWDEALTSLDSAEGLFALAIRQQRSMARNETLDRQLSEGLLVCSIARADVALRQGDLTSARDGMNRATAFYMGSGDEGRADLWRLVARLGEREGRWQSARMAWQRVARMCARFDDPRGRTDALVRLTEVLVLLNRPADADPVLAEAEEAARNAMEPSLLGRVHMARAGLFELEGETELAWERWQDSLEAFEGSAGLLQGLARVRMALLAARIRPLEAAFLLREGLKNLLEVGHPDALGLVHHQLALVALEMGHERVAALAAVGADRARGYTGVATRSILERALAVVEGPEPTVDDLARLEGVSASLGGRRCALELCDRLSVKRDTPRPPIARDVSRQPRVVWSEGGEMRETPIYDGITTLGDDADIAFPSKGVRVSFRKDASGVRVNVDPFSPQPVLLDGHAIRGEHFLTDGDVLTLGDVELKHVLPSAPRRPSPTLPSLPPPPVRPDPPEPTVGAVAATPSPKRRPRRLFGMVAVVGVGVGSALFGAALGAACVILAAAF